MIGYAAVCLCRWQSSGDIWSDVQKQQLKTSECCSSGSYQNKENRENYSSSEDSHSLPVSYRIDLNGLGAENIN